MIIKDFLNVLEEHNIPDNVKIICDSKCGDVEAIFYSKDRNCLNLIQGETLYLNQHIREYLIYLDKELADESSFAPIYNSVFNSEFKKIGYAVLDENNQVIVKPLEEKELTF